MLQQPFFPIIDKNPFQNTMLNSYYYIAILPICQENFLCIFHSKHNKLWLRNLRTTRYSIFQETLSK